MTYVVLMPKHVWTGAVTRAPTVYELAYTTKKLIFVMDDKCVGITRKKWKRQHYWATFDAAEEALAFMDRLSLIGGRADIDDELIALSNKRKVLLGKSAEALQLLRHLPDWETDNG